MKKRTKRIVRSSLGAFAVFLVVTAVCAAVFVAISLKSAGFGVGAPATEAESVPVESEAEARSEYLIDLSDYEKYINPTGSKRDAFLALVNAENAGKAEKELVALGPERSKSDVTLHPYAAMALEAMLMEMEAENVRLINPDTGLTLSVTAGFRDSDVHDEHITGLSVDMHSCAVSDISFKNTEAYGWLSENCWKFGFIVRYPEGKSAVTGVSFRPWQFRYVGRFHAKEIHFNNLTLEEYLKGTK